MAIDYEVWGVLSWANGLSDSFRLQEFSKQCYKGFLDHVPRTVYVVFLTLITIFHALVSASDRSCRLCETLVRLINRVRTLPLSCGRIKLN